MPEPVLLIGGAGIVGGWTSRFLRAANPDLPLLIGGRDLDKACKAAAALGHAEGVAVDLAADDLGLGQRPVGAVAVLFMDAGLASLRFAQKRGAGHISISPAIHEIGPEVAAYMHQPHAAPVVLGAEWLVGATTVPALEFAKAFGCIDRIAIGALLDDQDVGGPEQVADLERVTAAGALALARRNGTFHWRVGDDARASFRAADGTEMTATALSPYDVVGLATATAAPNVRFDVATGVSSTRRRGGPMSTEIVIDLAGSDPAGRPLRTRHAVIHPEGQMPLTGLGVAMVLERLVGLDGNAPTPPGLYFPYQLLEPAAYLDRLKRSGGTTLELDAGER